VAEVNIGWADEDDRDYGINKKREPLRFGGVILAMQITPNADRQAVSKKIDEALKQLQDDLPSGIKIARSVDQRFDDLVKLTIQELVRERPPGWEYRRRSTNELSDHLVAGKSDRAVIKIIGPDLKVLRSNAEKLLVRLSKVPGVTDLRVDPPADIPELKIELDKEASARFGLTAADVPEALGMAIIGKVVAQIREGKQVIDVLVKANHSVDQAEIGRHLIRTESGELVPLNQLATLKVEAVPPVIYSENLQPVVFVSYAIKSRDEANVQADVQEALRSVQQSLKEIDGNYRIER
jgi:Cu/Ag efflux pump CusA